MKQIKNYDHKYLIASFIIVGLITFSIFNFTPTGAITLNTIPGNSGNGILQITSTPTGAQVYIDTTTLRGTTPYTTTLTPGIHKLILKKQGYQEYTKKITITRGQTTIENAILTRQEPTTTIPPIKYGVASLDTTPYNDLFITGAVQTIDITDYLNETNNFGSIITHRQLETLKDSEIRISRINSWGTISGTYDYHEEIRLGMTSLETGLTYPLNRDDSWKENIFIAMPTQSIGYYYVFDENLASGNRISGATPTNPINITFLGRELEIIGAIRDDSITIRDASTGASIIYRDGDAYIGENISNPIWEWDLKGLFSDGFITEEDLRLLPSEDLSFKLGVTLSPSINSPLEYESPLVMHPVYSGDYMCLPNFYACIVFEKMTQEDQEFKQYEIKPTAIDLYSTQSSSRPLITNAKVLELRTKYTTTNGIRIGNNDASSVYAYINRSGLSLFRKNQNKAIYFTHSPMPSGRPLILDNIFALNNENTNINVDLLYNIILPNHYTDLGAALLIDSVENSTTYSGLRSNSLGSYVNPGDIVIYFANSSADEITDLGSSSEITRDAGIPTDLRYANKKLMRRTQYGGYTVMPVFTEIGNWEENTRTKEGIIIYDPQMNSLSDKVEISIPRDINDYEAVIHITSPK